MIRQESFNWIIGIGLSLAVHAGLFMQAGMQLGTQNAQVLNVPMITRLNFVQETRPQPVQDVKPEPIKPEPVKPKPKPEPIESVPVKQEQVTQTEAEPVQQVAVAQPKGQSSQQIDALLLQQQHDIYMHDLLTHIEGHKFYPRAARRRGIEGEIKVSFLLQADGGIRDMKLEGEQSVLLEAARQAMESAQPLPLPPPNLSLPRPIRIGIVYSLRTSR